MTQLPECAPAGLDVTRPSAARIYDHFLGGAHNFESDRQTADHITRPAPDVAATARANRHVLRRPVTLPVGAGIRQFLGTGSGIPTVGNVHEVAGEPAPDTRIVYVDLDPVEPGPVYIGRWRPDRADEPDPHPERLAGYAGVGRKG